jgi:hypothetical protein
MWWGWKESSDSKKNWARYDQKMYIGLDAYRSGCISVWMYIGLDAYRSGCKVSGIIIRFELTGIFWKIFEKNAEISNLIKIHLVGVELLHSDGWTDRYDEANSCFFATAPENTV